MLTFPECLFCAKHLPICHLQRYIIIFILLRRKLILRGFTLSESKSKKVWSLGFESGVSNSKAGLLSPPWKVFSRCHEDAYRMGCPAPKWGVNPYTFRGSFQHVREVKTAEKRNSETKISETKVLQRAEKNFRETAIDNLRENERDMASWKMSKMPQKGEPWESKKLKMW